MKLINHDDTIGAVCFCQVRTAHGGATVWGTGNRQQDNPHFRATQDIALADARKGLEMFQKVNVPVLGIVENMSFHICSSCGHEEAIFGGAGGTQLAEEYDVPLLGAIPLDATIGAQTDRGTPTVVAEPDGAVADAYRKIALASSGHLAAKARDYSQLFPTITVEEG